MTTDPDFDLLEAWRAGDRTSGDRLFERHFTSLFRFFRTKLDDTIAEDLTQETLLACVGGKDAFRSASSFRTYLFSIARNHLYTHFRKRARRDAAVELGSRSVVDLGAGPSTLTALKAEQTLLMKALRRIPLEFQIAVELYYWQGLSTHELAEVLGIPGGTARSRLTRAREHLERQMRSIADDPSLADSTIGDFEAWAASLRD